MPQILAHASFPEKADRTLSTPVQEIATIAIRKLYKHYGTTSALRGIDLEVQQGELFGLIGPDGAGKTTAFNILGGVMEATAGNALILDYLPEMPATTSGI